MPNTNTPLKILFASSEVFPLIKTGGLADVSGGLPRALKALGHDVRIVMPAYGALIATFGTLSTVAHIYCGTPVWILQGLLPRSNVPVYFIDIPQFFARTSGPYQDHRGHDWVDNAERFAAFSRAVVEIAMDRTGAHWKPDILHCNDWQTGLAPALLSSEGAPPASVFTIHNLAYQGVFDRLTFDRLDLPKRFWAPEALEFYSNLSFIKGGLVFADMVNTVSPTYAREIRQPEFGYGLDGLLNDRGERLAGILNGVDYSEWNPKTDEHLTENFDINTLTRKAANKRAAQERFGLPVDASIPLIAIIGRIVEQKGFDLILDSLDWLSEQPLQIAMIGSGDKRLEQALADAACIHPDRFALHLGYNEPLAHLLEGGADMFLMPSRFEPCGLNQIYSQHYGTIPIVHCVGGLADSVVDATPAALSDGTATGFQFDYPSARALHHAVWRALQAYKKPKVWRQLQRAGMERDFSWERAAAEYVQLYGQAISVRGAAEAAKRAAMFATIQPDDANARK